ncbi:glycosyltransferase family 2 protein [Thermodesulfobacteriota bacterium]
MIFSVIIPFHNEQLYIERCILSLLDQNFDPDEYEIIFVDNGSDDRSGEIVKKFPRIKLLFEHRKNPYTARNSALKIAKGEIIAFTDADCVVSKDWLKVIHDKMEKVRPTILLGKVLFPATKGVPVSILQDYQNAKIEYLLQGQSKRYLYGYTNNMAVSAIIFRKLGPFLEWPVPGDTEIIHRSLKRMPNTKVQFIQNMEVLHLEIGSVLNWLKKSYIYGKHNVLVSFYADYKPFNLGIMREISKFCSSHNSYSLKERLVMLFLQKLLSIVYAAGMLGGYLKFVLLKRYSVR